MIWFPAKLKNLYVIGMYPSPETTPEIKTFIDRIFSTFNYYGANVQVISDPAEAMNLSSLPHVSVELPGQHTKSLPSFVHPEKAVYLFGNSKYRNLGHWFDNVEHRVHIPMPDYGEDGIYGFQAASIVLNDRYIKNGSDL